MNTQKCRSCGAAILWCKTEKGKAMPVDAEPSENGNVMLVGDVAKYVKPGETLPGIALHLSHFATCPNAAHHRKAQ